MIVLVIVLSLSVALVQGKPCVCKLGSHPQDLFCRADFVLRGQVLSDPVEDNLPNPPQSRAFRHWAKHRSVLSHMVQVTQIFKGSDKVGQAGLPVAKQPKEGGAPVPFNVKVYADITPCPVWLRSRTEYLLAGLVDDGKLFISSCHWTSPWQRVTQAQKLGVQSVYGDNCRCRVNSCSFLGPGGRMLNSHCSNSHLYCGEHGLSCLWKPIIKGTKEEYNRCKASVLPALNQVMQGRSVTRLARLKRRIIPTTKFF